MLIKDFDPLNVLKLMIDFCGQKLTNNWKRQKQLEINKKIKIYESNRWVSQYKNLLDNGMIDFNEKW